MEHRGEFALRGGVLDVFPGTARRPVRLDYWGDEVESIREFVPSTQLSTDRVALVEVPATRELIPDEDLRDRARRAAREAPERFADQLERLADGLFVEGAETLAPFLFDHMPTPAELLPAGSWVVLTHAHRTIDRARAAHLEAEALAEATSWPARRVVRSLDDAIGDRVRVHLTEFAEGLDLGLAGWGTAQGNAAELAARAGPCASAGTASCSPRTATDRSSAPARCSARASTVEPVESPLADGFLFEPGELAVITEEDLFGSRRHTRAAPRFTRRRTDSIADELEPGDYAVHRIHGVGRYTGITHRALAGAERDYLVLEYAGGDKLFVPSDAVGMVAKYVGGDTPRLHRMGGSDWARATAKVKRAVRDMAGELVRLYTVRLSVPGHAFGPDTPWQQELEDAFPHEETTDQQLGDRRGQGRHDASQADGPPDLRRRRIRQDRDRSARRLQGRHGGQAGGRCSCPTTLLAEQHFITFSERFAPFPVTVKMLSRFVGAAEQKRVVDEVKAGKVDVVIGTHRLLGKDVAFRDLGLLVVDEEQRFGVAHKERLKQFRASVDVLTMTATPIPRTLEMALTGIREMSTIDTPPEDRQPVLTYVGSYDEGLALGAVRRELLREGQVFWVHNRVATIDRQAAWLIEQLPDARIVVAHGKMDEAQLERQMMRFWNREADVLVSTVIIESGLDVPNANTLVVDRADLLGLAQMYQLRGRVGRSTERAFAYFFFPPQREMTDEARERLATISANQALGSGFKIAMKDLEIRGAGNMLGAEQSGHIAAVGFDAYARILQESMAEMKGEHGARGTGACASTCR